MEHAQLERHKTHALHTSPEALPSAAETLLLELAHQARAGKLEASGLPVSELAELEERYDLSAVKARLGPILPALTFAQEAAAIQAFDEHYYSLPTDHPRHNHAHHGHDHDDGCGKTHGPVRRALEAFERGVLGRIRSQRLRLVAAMAFRGSSLALCPGDDIAAIGLQMYGAFSGHTGHDHAHQEHVAILPRRPRIQFESNTAYLPLDAPVRHNELPHTPAGDLIREHVADPELPTKNKPAPNAPERSRTAERPRRRLRMALVGVAAVAFTGIGLSVAQSPAEPPARHEAAAPQMATPQIPSPALPERSKPEPSLYEVKAQKGDSIWRLAERDAKKTLGRSGRTPLINILAHLGVQANGSVIVRPGQQVHMPTAAVVKKLDHALHTPAEADPRLVAAMRALNDQPRFDSAEAGLLADQIEGYI